MTVTFTVSDSCATELRRALAIEPTSSPRPTPEPTQQPPAQPPVQQPVPSGDWQSIAASRAVAQGFDRCLVYDWDWNSTIPHIDTQSLGMVGARGVLVVSFVPSYPADHANIAFLDAIGYPAPPAGRQLSATLSTTPVDFNITAPYRSTGEAPTLAYGVGSVNKPWMSPPREAALSPGVRCFLSVAGIDEYNTFTYEPNQHGEPEFRVHFRKPSGH